MAFQISPGVNVSEIDLTTVIPAVGTTGGAFAGPFQWGPLNEVVQVDSELTLVNEFGEPNSDVAIQWFTAKNFLDYGNNLNVVRVAGANAKNSTSDGSGELIKNLDDYLTNHAAGTDGKGKWAGKYPGVLGNGLIVSMADAGNYNSWAYKANFTGVPGTSDFVAGKGGSNDELHIIVVDGAGLWTGIAGSILEVFPFASKASDAQSADGSSTYYVNVINRNSKYIWWIGFPTTTPANNWGTTAAVSNVGTNFDLLDTVLVFSSLISGTDYTVGETVNVFQSVVNSISNGAGVDYETTPTLAIATPEAPGIPATGHAVLSSTGRVKSVTVVGGGGSYSPDGVYTVPISGSPGTGATIDLTVTGGVIQPTVGTLVRGSGFTSGSTTTTAAFDLSGLGGGVGASLSYKIGYTVASAVVDNPGSGYESAPVVTPSGGTPTTPATFTAVVTLSGTPVASGTVLSWVNGSKTLTIATTLGTIDATDDEVIGATSATKGIPSSVTAVGITDTLAGAVDANSLGVGGAHVTNGELISGFDLFANVEQIDIALLLTANYGQPVTEHVIQNVAELRKDAVAFLSPQFSDVVSNVGFEAASTVVTRNTYASSSYAFMDSNWMYMYDKYNDVFRWVPCNGGVAGLAVATDQLRDPWFSFAGLNRGILKNVVKLAWNPSKTFRDTLYAAGVNPIVSFPGEGPVLFGDKTMLAKPSAFDRVNVRRLFIVLEKAISTASKFQLFEFNDAFTQAQFVSMVEPFLRDVQGRRGITDFRVVCDSSNNTPDVVDTNRFVGDIYIKPARSINFIQLNFVAVRTGVDFSEIVGKF